MCPGACTIMEIPWKTSYNTVLQLLQRSREVRRVCLPIPGAAFHDSSLPASQLESRILCRLSHGRHRPGLLCSRYNLQWQYLLPQHECSFRLSHSATAKSALEAEIRKSQQTEMWQPRASASSQPAHATDQQTHRSLGQVPWPPHHQEPF